MSRSDRRPAAGQSPDLLDPVVVKLTRRHAARLCRQPGFTKRDFPDVEQSLLAGLAARRRFYDPGRGAWRAFAATVLRRLAETLRRRRHTLRHGPLRQARRREDWTFDPRRPQADGQLGDRDDLHLDLTRVLADLPPGLAALADRLKFENLTAASRSLGVSRRTARDRLARLRKRFEQAGLEIYC